MIGPFIFLDIDGVLNGHNPHTNGYCGCDADNVRVLNGILNQTGAKIVVASAWRYFVLRGEMTVQGFGGMMCTHGLKWGSIVDVLGPDKFPDDRGALIEEWFAAKWGLAHERRYVVLDDMDLGYTRRRMPFMQTKPKEGVGYLSQREIDHIVNILHGVHPLPPLVV